MSSAFGDMGNLLKQAQKMQRDLELAREELKTARVTGTAGGGVVSVDAMVPARNARAPCVSFLAPFRSSPTCRHRLLSTPACGMPSCLTSR